MSIQTSTIADDGSPTENPYEDLRRVLALAKDIRFLCAHELYVDVLNRLGDQPEVNSAPDRSENDTASVNTPTPRGNKHPFISKKKEGQNEIVEKRDQDDLKLMYAKASKLLEDEKEEFLKIEGFSELFLSAKECVNIDKDWIFSHTLFGVSTYYRQESDDSVSVKVVGNLNGVPLFEQLAVVREMDLYNLWAPFCQESKLIRRLGTTDSLGYFNTVMPFFSRESVLRAIACDSMKENGCVYMCGQGVDDKISNRGDEHSSYLADTIPADTIIPPKPTSFGSRRSQLNYFYGIIKIISPESARTTLVTNFDPNIDFLPKWLKEFALKKLYGILLYVIQKTARRISKNPVKSLHAKRMRQDKDFYQNWLVPRFKSYCEEYEWELPEISAFNVDKNLLVVEGETLVETDDSRTVQSNFSNDAHASPMSVASSSSSTSKLSLASGIKWIKQREQRMEVKKQRYVDATRRKAAKRLVPKPILPEKTSRLKELMRKKEELGEKDKRTLTQQTALVAHKSVKETIVTSYIELSKKHTIGIYLFMIVAIYGNFPFYKWNVFCGESKSWESMFVSFLTCSFLLLLYGLGQVTVIWSSLMVIFDVIESAAFPTLMNSRKLVSVTVVFLFQVSTSSIVFVSFARTLAVLAGRSLAQATIWEGTISGPMSFLSDAHDLSSDVSHGTDPRYILGQIGQLLLQGLSFGMMLINELGKASLLLISLSLRRVYYLMRDTGEPWQKVYLELPTAWMVYSATFFVLLSLAFKILVGSNRKKHFTTT